MRQHDLNVFVLGRTAISYGDGAPVVIRGQTARMLMCLLACGQGRPIFRLEIAKLLWGDEDEDASARLKLRQTLFRLRSQVSACAFGGDRSIRSNAETIWLSGEGVRVDLAEIERLLDLGSEGAVEEAFSLFGGDIFGGEESRSLAFTQWAWARNSDLKQRLIEAGLNLARSYRRDKLTAPAQTLLRRVAAIAPTDQDVHRMLIDLELESGRYESARKWYRRYADALKRELDEEPGSDVAELFERARPQVSLPSAAPQPVAQAQPTLRGSLPTSICAPEPIAASRMVSALSIGLSNGGSRPSFLASPGGQAMWSRIESIVERAVVGLDGEVLLSTPGQIEAVFTGTHGAETTPLRATYAASRILPELAPHLHGAASDPNGRWTILCGIATRSSTPDDGATGSYSMMVVSALEEAGALGGLGQGGAIVICGNTYDNVNPVFVCEQVPHKLPVETDAYVLKARRQAPRHFEIRVNKGLAPMVGRGGELALLKEKWNQVENGDIQLIVVRGELGSGRSRLVHELERYVESKNGFIIHLDCTFLHSDVPFYPIVKYVETFFDIASGEQPSVKRRKIERVLASHGQDCASYRPIIEGLVNGTFDGASPTRSEQRHDAVYPMMYKLLRFICGDRPVLVVIDDIDWTDPFTLNFLDHVHGIPASLGHLMVATIATNSPLPEPLERANAVLGLGPLPLADCEALIDAYDTEKAIKPTARAQLVKASAAIPLYLEELVRSAISRGAGNATAGAAARRTVMDEFGLPAGESGLLRQFGLIGKGESTARAASVIGRVFSVPLLAELVGGTLDEVKSRLKRLQDGRIVAPMETGDATMMKFRHALVRDTIYFSMPRNERVRLNRTVADIVSGPKAALFQYPPEMIAQHYLEAEVPMEAVSHLIDAGVRACATESNVEALTFFESGLEIVSQQQRTKKAYELEARLCLELGALLISMEGAGSRSVGDAFRRARDAALAARNPRQHFRSTWGLWYWSMVRSDLRKASWLSEELHRESNRIGDSNLLLEARHCLWTTSHLTGHLDVSWKHINVGLEAYNKVAHQELANGFGDHDPGVCARMIGAIVAFLRGDAARAGRLSAAALELAAELRHSGSLAQALWGALDVAVFADDARRLERYTGQLADLASAHNYANFAAIARIFDGWARVRYSGDAEGIRGLEEGLAIKSEGEGLGLPFQLWLSADALAQLGRCDQALARIERAREAATSSGEVWWLAELYRTELALRLRTNGVVDDEHHRLFVRGVKLAESQGARFLLDRFRSLAAEVPELDSAPH